MNQFLEKLFSSEFMPHGHCYYWMPSILWMHVVSDAIITIAYYSIPIALLVVIKRRKDLAFSWIFVLFSIFIFACGTTHLMEIWTVWHGTYRLSGIVKVITALASIFTAIAMWPLIPKLLLLPSPKQLEDVNNELLKEVAVRKSAEEKLINVNYGLEEKVQQATMQLQLALAQKNEFLARERDARADAEKAGRLKDEFLTTLSHELRTPLNAISSWIQVLLDTAPADTKSSEIISVLRRNVSKLSGIIDDLLDMSTILSGSVMLNSKPYDLVEIAREVTENLRPTAESKNIHVKTHLDSVVPVLKGDALRIRQIIWNLLINAIKFTPSGKNVSLTVAVKEASVILTVADEGKGIDPQFLPYVFDRFRQESGSSTREYSGLGLGLSIAKQLAELHGGSIVAESEGAGFGSKFTLSLPTAL